MAASAMPDQGGEGSEVQRPTWKKHPDEPSMLTTGTEDEGESINAIHWPSLNQAIDYAALFSLVAIFKTFSKSSSERTIPAQSNVTLIPEWNGTDLFETTGTNFISDQRQHSFID